jgi:uncharacterized RmlC-like cupin family protein
MTWQGKPTCQVFRADKTYHGKQGFDYFSGISAETAGATGICMHLLTIPPGGRAKAHMHENHETAIYVLSGEGQMWYGHDLVDHMILREGDVLYIPAGVPHLPANLSDAPVTAVIARTDPNEQESVVLLPDLDGLVPQQEA